MEAVEIKPSQIAKLNDNARKTGLIKLLMSSGIEAKFSTVDVEAIIQTVQNFETYFDFDEGNDLYGEHDFGSFNFKNEKIFWKIDCYEADSNFYLGADPSDKTAIRVLTIMLAEDY